MKRTVASVLRQRQTKYRTDDKKLPSCRLYRKFWRSMDLDDTPIEANGRKKSLTGIRLFKDQIKDLEWLIVHKFKGNRTKADLIRDAVDQFIDRERK